MRDEVERLATSIRSLIAYQAEAHQPIAKVDAQGVAVATYYLVAQLATRTDMQAVVEYGDPSVQSA
jgi:hypothetical protein